MNLFFIDNITSQKKYELRQLLTESCQICQNNVEDEKLEYWMELSQGIITIIGRNIFTMNVLALFFVNDILTMCIYIHFCV